MSARRLALAALLAAGVAGSCEHDEPRPTTPSVAAPASSVPGSGPFELVRPAGFDLVEATLTSPDGDAESLTLWFAATPDQHRRGLMHVTDLGRGDGMVFDFGVPGRYRFYMWQTPMPLDIVFFDAAGQFAGAATMTPCVAASSAACDRYTPEGPFLMAVELPAGVVDDLGVDVGWTLTYSSVPLATDAARPTSPSASTGA